MKTSTFNTVKAIFLMLTITAIASLLTGCAKPPAIPIAWWVKCHSEIQAPADRVGGFDGQFFTTRSNSELYGCLPTPYGFAEHKDVRSIYSVHLTGLKANDIINFNATAELTNDLYGSDVLVAWYVELADSPTNVDGLQLNHPHGYNLSSDMHHGIVSESDSVLVTKDYDSIYLNFVVYSAGAAMIDANLVIEPNYGGLNGTVIKSKPAREQH